LKNVIVFTLAAVFLMLLFIGCTSLNPEQAKLVEDMQARQSEIYSEIKKVSDQIERLKAKKDDLIAKVKAGELSAAEGAELILIVSNEINEAITHYNNLHAEGKALAADIKELNESGLKWYETAGYLILGAIAAYFGKEKFTLQTAVTGLVRAIEFGKSKSDMKKKASSLNNPAIEKAVLKLPSVSVPVSDGVTAFEIPPKEEPPAKE